MSTTVDSKVVEMRFDNKQFENNVAQTMSTLDKFKHSLKLDGASKGLENVNAAAKKVDMNSLGSAVETVRTKFSALEIMGVTALVNITNSAVNAGKKMVKALTLDPIMSGFQEYETQMNAVQTILANTQSKGSTIDDVNKALDTLNEYADKTIYNFTEMTRNIGTFTAAGVDLQTSVDSIQGIANLAAVSGSTSQQASTAMYQLSQALAAGTVKLMDWNSVVNAGMGGELFQNALKRTSQLLGTGAEAAIKATGSFRESLKEEWLTSEVLTETLKQLSGAYTEAELVAQGYTESQAKEIVQLANTATDAATKVKTFSQLWDVMKEAAQSGWAQTWRLIIGDFEQAKALLTPLADFMTGVINGMSEARNKLLEGALGKGFKDLAKKINGILEPAKQAAKTMQKVTNTVKDLSGVVNNVIRGDFGNGAARVKALTEAGENYYRVQNKVNETLGNSFRYSQDQIDAQDKLLGKQKQTTTTTEEVTAADKKLILELAKLSDEQLRAKGYTEDQIKAFRELRDTADKLGLPLEEFINNLDDINGRWLLINSFKNIGQGLVAVLTAVRDAWKEIFPPATSDQLFNVIAGFHKFTMNLRVSDETADKIKRTLKGVFAILDLIFTVIGGPIKIAFRVLNQILGMFDLNLLDLTAYLGDTIVRFRDFVKGNSLVTKALETVVDWVVIGIGKIKSLLKAFTELPMVKGIVESIKQAFMGATNLGWNLIEGLTNGLGDGAKFILDKVYNLGVMILDAIKKVLGIHSPSTETYDIGTNFIQGFVNAIKDGIAYVLSNIVSLVNTVISYVRQIDWAPIIGIAVGITAIRTVSKVADALENFSAPFAGVGEVLEETAKVVKSFKKVTKSMAKTMNAYATNLKAEALFTAAKAILALVAAIVIITMIPVGQLWAAIGAIAALAGILIALSIAVNKLSATGDGGKDPVSQLSGIVKMATAIVAISAALVLMAIALGRIANIETGNLVKAMVTMTILIAEMAALMFVFGKFVKGDAAKNIADAGRMIMKIATALLLITFVIKILGGMDIAKLGQGILAVTLLSGIVVGLMAATRLVASGEKNIGKTLQQIATAILILGATVRLIGGMDPESLAKGIATVDQLCLFMIKLMIAVRLFSKDGKNTGSTLMGIAGAIAILAITVRLIGGMDPESMAKGLIAIEYLKSIIIGLLIAVRLFAKDGKNVGVTIILLAASIGILAAVMTLLSLLDPADMAKGIAAIAALSAVMMGLIYVTKYAKKCKDELIVLTTAVTLLAVAIGILSFIDTAKLLGASLALSAVIASFSLVVAALKNAKKAKNAIPTLIVMTACVAAIGGILYLLAGLPANQAIASGAALTLVMLSMAATLTVISKLGQLSLNAYLSIGAMVLVVAALGGIILAMTHWAGVDATVKIANALSNMLLSFSVACVILAGVGAVSSLAIAGAGAMVVLVGIVGVLMLALAGLNALIPDLQTFLATGIQVLNQIAYGIGSFIGNIVKGFLESALSALPTIGTHLSDFMNNLSGFLAGAEKITPQMMEGVMSLATVILTLTAASLLDGIARFIGGGSSISKFATELAPLGKGMSEFAKNCEGIDPDKMARAADAAKALSAVASSLPREGGLVGAIAGATDMVKFADELDDLAKGLSEFSKGVVDVDPDKIEVVAEAAKTLTDMASTLPKHGGWVQAITGDSSLAEFATDFVELGKGLVELSDVATGIKTDVVDTAVESAKTIVDMANTIPNSGGMVAWFTGDNSMADWAYQLTPLGHGLFNFYTAVQGVKPEVISAAAEAAKTIANMANTIPDSGGIVSWFAGDNSMATWAYQLKPLGDGLYNFYDAVQNVKPEVISAVAPAMAHLAILTRTIPEEKGILSWFGSKNSIAKFGNQLKPLGDGLGAFYDGIKGITNPSAISAAAPAMAELAAITRIIPEEKGILAWFGSKNSVAEFGNQLGPLGAGLAAFAKQANSIKDPDKVQSLAYAAKTLGEMQQYIPSLKEWETWLGGSDVSLTNFSGQLGSLGEGVAAFASHCTNVNPLNVKEAAEATKYLAEASTHVQSLTTIKEAQMNGFSNSIMYLGTGIQEFNTKVADIDTAAIEAGARAAITFAFIAGMEGLSNASSFSEFGDAVETLGDSIALFSVRANDLHYDDMESGVDFIESLIVACNKMGGNTVTNSEGFVTFAANVGTAISDLMKNMDAKKYDAEKFESATGAISKLGDTCVEFSGEDFNADRLTSFANGISATVTALSSLITAISEDNGYDEGKFTALIDKLMSIDTEKLSSVCTTLSELAATIMEVLTVDLSTAGTDALSGFLDSFTSETATETVTTAMTTMITNLVDAIGNETNSKSVKDAGSDLISTFISGINGDNEDESTLTTALTSTVSTALTAINDKTEDYKTVGKNIVTGICDGIKDSTLAAKLRAIALANAIKKAAEDTLGIESPSTVFASIGMFLDKGLALGIDKYRKEPIKAAETAACLVADKTREVFDINSPSGLFEMFGAFDMFGLEGGILGNMDAPVSAAELAGIETANAAMDGFTFTLDKKSKKDKTPEEIAEKKANAISDAFQKGLDENAETIQSIEGMYSLWEAKNPDASEVEKSLNKIDSKNKILVEQLENAGIYQIKYNTLVEEFGKDSSVAVKALNEWLDAEVTVANTMNEIADEKKNSLSASESLDDYESRMSTLDNEYKLWETLNSNATDVEKESKKLETLLGKQSWQMKAVADAQESYNKYVSEYGENSKEAREQYDILLAEQIQLAEIMNETNTIQDSIANRNSDSFAAYADYMKNNANKLLEWGMTMEDVMVAASTVSGYDPYAELKDAGSTSINTITAGIQNGEGQVVNATTNMLTSCADGISAQMPNWIESGKQLAEGFIQGVCDTLNAAATATASSGILDSFNKIIRKISEQTDSEINTQPVIRPILDLSDFREGTNHINDLFANRTMALAGINAGYISVGGDNINTLMDKMQSINDARDEKFLTELENLRGDVRTLAGAIAGMHIRMDSGAVVGSIVGKIDNSLGQIATHKGRGN